MKSKPSHKDARRIKPRERSNLPVNVKVQVLTEASYRCALPACRFPLALDIHHIWEVHAGGGDDPSNLIALCSNCHRLYHGGHIKQESIYVYKMMLLSLTKAYDVEVIDRLLFLNECKQNELVVTGDGLLHLGKLVASGLAKFSLASNNNYQIVTYIVNISDKGKMLMEAWKAGDQSKVRNVMRHNDTHATESKDD